MSVTKRVGANLRRVREAQGISQVSTAVTDLEGLVFGDALVVDEHTVAGAGIADPQRAVLEEEARVKAAHVVVLDDEIVLRRAADLQAALLNGDDTPRGRATPGRSDMR